jgi:septal ring factor EnvC (AmiA/AmiB activator)
MAEYIPIALVFTCVSTIIGAVTFYRGIKKDSKASAIENLLQLDPIKEALVKCNTKLDQIFTTTNETRADVKAMDLRIQDIDKRTSILERDVSTAFKKIDELRTEVEHEQRT